MSPYPHALAILEKIHSNLTGIRDKELYKKCFPLGDEEISRTLRYLYSEDYIDKAFAYPTGIAYRITARGILAARKKELEVSICPGCGGSR